MRLLIVLSESGILRSSDTASSPNIIVTVCWHAGKITLSAMVWDFILLATISDKAYLASCALLLNLNFLVNIKTCILFDANFLLKYSSFLPDNSGCLVVKCFFSFSGAIALLASFSPQTIHKGKGLCNFHNIVELLLVGLFHYVLVAWTKQHPYYWLQLRQAVSNPPSLQLFPIYVLLKIVR